MNTDTEYGNRLALRARVALDCYWWRLVASTMHAQRPLSCIKTQQASTEVTTDKGAN